MRGKRRGEGRKEGGKEGRFSIRVRDWNQGSNDNIKAVERVICNMLPPSAIRYP
jgi:hypothetical protein